MNEGIRNYSPKSMDNFFFDNNVWIYLFCPIGNHDKNKQRVYSSFLQAVKQVNATIWINSMVVSEFANVCIRLDYNLWKDEEVKRGNYHANLDYKSEYRTTERYSSTVQSVSAAIKQILSMCEKCTDNFNALNLQSVLSTFGRIDFNDSYYWELCNLSSFKLVTDDADFLRLSSGKVVVLGDF